jgi:hypothetical protein
VDDRPNLQRGIEAIEIPVRMLAAQEEDFYEAVGAQTAAWRGFLVTMEPILS